jgi:hypothetical protein
MSKKIDEEQRAAKLHLAYPPFHFEHLQTIDFSVMKMLKCIH